MHHVRRVHKLQAQAQIMNDDFGLIESQPVGAIQLGEQRHVDLLYDGEEGRELRGSS